MQQLQIVFFVWLPAGIVGKRLREPAVGGFEIGGIVEHLRVALLQVPVARILDGKLLHFGERRVGLTDRLQQVDPAFFPAFERLEVRRLPFIEGLEPLQHGHLLVGFENVRRLRDDVSGDKHLVTGNRLLVGPGHSAPQLPRAIDAFRRFFGEPALELFMAAGNRQDGIPNPAHACFPRQLLALLQLFEDFRPLLRLREVQEQDELALER